MGVQSNSQPASPSLPRLRPLPTYLAPHGCCDNDLAVVLGRLCIHPPTDRRQQQQQQGVSDDAAACLPACLSACLPTTGLPWRPSGLSLAPA